MMMIYDKGNLADDTRNNKMSDLAQDNEFMQKVLREITEIWAGSEAVICSTSSEHYLKKLCTDMYNCSARVLQQIQ